ncbi:AprI/Inh family metalloprotease inhibitor [uncultured Brevundimonas sp.]|uniref:AprI/Inh family metalloprotease inhibitor n=1 Tax=uncultured Brevundimonas sp. TaxID=213418 RepID=UPI0030EC72C9|tara:strand:+ start:2570 stop:2983 length:414 start_codon:yes stop_codon:yes gene_type:complete
MSSFLSVPTAVAVVILAVTPAAACQSRNDAMPQGDQTTDIPAPIGLWDIRPADSATPGLCRLALRGEGAGDGHRVVVETCDLKAARRTHHWRATPTGFSLVDAAGVTLIAFTPDTVDAWTGVGADGRTYRMDRTALF